MSDVVYVSISTIERRQGLFVLLNLPGKSQPVFSVHGAIPKRYRVDPAKLQESHSSTIDCGWCARLEGRWKRADRRCYRRDRDRRRRIGYKADQRSYVPDRIGGQP